MNKTGILAVRLTQVTFGADLFDRGVDAPHVRLATIIGAVSSLWRAEELNVSTARTNGQTESNQTRRTTFFEPRLRRSQQKHPPTERHVAGDLPRLGPQGYWVYQYHVYSRDSL